MTIATLRKYLENNRNETDSYLVVFFSKEENKYNGFHYNIDESDGLIIIQELIKNMDIDKKEFVKMLFDKKNPINQSK